MLKHYIRRMMMSSTSVTALVFIAGAGHKFH